MFCSYKADGSYLCNTSIIEKFGTNLNIGNNCIHNTECKSQVCSIIGSIDGGGICQKGSVNKPCETNNDCISNICTNQRCAKGGLNAECRQHNDCANNKKCEISICTDNNR